MGVEFKNAFVEVLYYDHIDDGNRKVNRGWCSDQGRGGQNLANADAGCLSRTQSRISRLVQRMRAARVEPEKHIEAFVNASDLWNQASPRVSDAFEKNYAEAVKKGLKNKQAILWARVESFRKSDGELEAGNSNFGLFSICVISFNICPSKLFFWRGFYYGWGTLRYEVSL